MIAYADTSFLFALYRQQDNSQAARKHYQAMTEPLHVSALLLYELRQSVRFQIWWHSQNPRKGIRTTKGEEALADLEANLASGAVVIVSADWADVHRTAERLSASYTKAEGHRALDILHVATALHLNTREFLTFDAKQRKLATAEGLKTKL